MTNRTGLSGFVPYGPGADFPIPLIWVRFKTTHLKRRCGPGRHGDEAAEEVGVAEEERDGEGARVGGRDDDHAAARLPVRRQDGPDQLAQEGGAVADAGAPRLSSPWIKGAIMYVKSHTRWWNEIYTRRNYWKKLARSFVFSEQLSTEWNC